MHRFFPLYLGIIGGIFLFGCQSRSADPGENHLSEKPAIPSPPAEKKPADDEKSVKSPSSKPLVIGHQVGQQAPDFTLQTEEDKSFRLASLKGKSGVLLAFYPKDFTGG